MIIVLIFVLLKIIIGVLLLSFIWVCLMDDVVWLMMCLLVVIEFVSDIICILGWLVSGLFIVLFLLNSMLIMFVGKIFFVSFVNFNVVSGVIFDGLSIM